MSVRKLLKGKGTFVPVIGSNVTLNEVIAQLEIDKAGALVVTDDNRNILGIITERDIARGLKTYGRNVVDRPVMEIMTARVITADIEEPIETVLELWRAQLATGHREEGPAVQETTEKRASKLARSPRAASRADDRQLSLFGDERSSKKA